MIYFFFDIDGTLLPFGGKVPQSAIDALDKVRAMGHRTFLATGRSPVEVLPDIYALGFRDGVFSAGGAVIADNKLIYSRYFSEEDRDTVFSYCRENNLGMMIQTPSGTYVPPRVMTIFREEMIKHTGHVAVLSSVIESDEIPSDEKINKVIYVTRNGSIERIRKDLSPRFDTVSNTLGVPDSVMGEIVLHGLSKATGIEKIMEYYGSDMSRAVVFGDGANDEEMVSIAGIGIAMGNASPHLKEKARYITADINDDGIAKGIDYALSILG